MASAKRRPKPPATIEGLIAGLDSRWREQVAALRSSILKSDEKITEHIKWNAPSFCYAGDDRVTFRFPPKGGVQLIFHRGAKNKDTTGFEFDDPTGLITWAAPDRGVVSFANPQDMDAKVEPIVELVRLWMHATLDS